MKLTNKLVALTMCLLSLTAAGCGKDKGVDLQILMTSDTHGFLVPYDYGLNAKATASLSQVATAIKQLRTDNTLVIDCGDAIQGNSSELFWKDDTHPMIEALNKMNYDVFVTGNHEFNHGVDYLQGQLKKFKGTALCGNVFKKSDNTPLADSYKIFTKGTVRIAVVGMVTHLITRWDGPNLKDWNVLNPIEETKKVVKNIKDNNLADVIVAAEHMGFPKEEGAEGTSCRDLATECPDIDVILASHEHRAQMETVNGVLIVENNSNVQTMMKVDLNVKKKDGKYKVDTKTSKKLEVKDFKEDEEINAFAEPYHKIAKADAETDIGTLVDGSLSPKYTIEPIPSTFKTPTALVGLINTVQFEAAKKALPDADKDKLKISCNAVGNYNANLVAGTIKKWNASNIYKFVNTLYIIKMNGKQLRQYLEWTAKFYNQYKAKDLTISFSKDISTFNYDMFSGIDYTIDVAVAPGEGRIKTLYWAGTTNPITDTEEFYLTTSNYRCNTQLFAYGEKAPIFKTKEDCPTLVMGDIDQGKGIRDMIVDYIKNQPNQTISATNPEYNKKNWSLNQPSWDLSKRSAAVSKINKAYKEDPSSVVNLIGEKNTRTFTEDDL